MPKSQRRRSAAVQLTRRDHAAMARLAADVEERLLKMATIMGRVLGEKGRPNRVRKATIFRPDAGSGSGGSGSDDNGKVTKISIVIGNGHCGFYTDPPGVCEPC
jgi:hypothetical protein